MFLVADILAVWHRGEAVDSPGDKGMGKTVDSLVGAAGIPVGHRDTGKRADRGVAVADIPVGDRDTGKRAVDRAGVAAFVRIVEAAANYSGAQPASPDSCGLQMD